MTSSHIQKSLKKFKKAIESLDLAKRVAASQWLQGVIMAQSLAPEERDALVQASNAYIEDFDEGEYLGAVNAMIDYLIREQRRAKRVLKKGDGGVGKTQQAQD